MAYFGNQPRLDDYETLAAELNFAIPGYLSFWGTLALHFGPETENSTCARQSPWLVVDA
jgi:hypothetical protein